METGAFPFSSPQSSPLLSHKTSTTNIQQRNGGGRSRSEKWAEITISVPTARSSGRVSKALDIDRYCHLTLYLFQGYCMSPTGELNVIKRCETLLCTITKALM